MHIFRSITLIALGTLVLCAATGAAAAGAVVFSDATFNPANYSQGFLFNNSDATNTATFAQCTACGNPGDALALTLDEGSDGGGAAGSTALLIGIVNSTFTYDPATQGAITSISASVDKDFTVTFGGPGSITFNNTFRPLIEQDGNFYVAAISGPILDAPGTTGYNTLSTTGLLASDFLEVNTATGAIGTANPNFDGDPITFGLAQLLGAVNPIDGATATIDFDNLNLTLSTTPEPASLALVGLGIAGLGAMRRRKRS